MNKNKYKVNVALIGIGPWGENYVKTIKNIPSIKLTHIYSKNKNKYKKFSITNDYQEIISNPNIHAVIIATPQKTHFKMAKEALLAKKDVLLEKPMASNSKECKELIRIAKKNKRILMIGHIFMYHPAIIKIKEIIDSGSIGKIKSIQSIRSSSSEKMTDINVIWNLAPHDISIANYLLNETPKKIRAYGFKLDNKMPYDTVDIILKYPSCEYVNIHVSWKEPEKIRKTLITGTKKIIVFDEMSNNKIKIFDLKKLNKFQNIPFESKTPLEKQCLHFISSIKKRTEPKTSGTDGYINAKIIEKIEREISKF